MKSGIELISEERQRQIESEGWTAEHDAEHTDQSIAISAALYAMPEHYRNKTEHDIDGYDLVDRFWAWEYRWWKPSLIGPSVEDNLNGRIKELQKAGALIAAEIDRLQNIKP